MRKKLILALIVANGLLAGSLMAYGGGSGGFDCCREDQMGNPYCCDDCCWFVQSCDYDADCREN